MKFIYIDESGPGKDDEGPGKNKDIFTMCGIMIDAYKLRKKTAAFDQKLKSLRQKNPGMPPEANMPLEMKTSRFINGKGAWKNIDERERQDFLTEICQLAVDNGGKIFGIGISLSSFKTVSNSSLGPGKRRGHWLSGAIFISCLVQKKMQSEDGNKGHTVLIMDDNKQDMSSLSNELYECDSWYDGLYKIRKKQPKTTKKKHPPTKTWLPRTPSNRLDQIINTAFAIKSHHSSLIQVADAIAYVYRRHLELMSLGEDWEGEKIYCEKLIQILEPAREKLGEHPNEPCIKFFKEVAHTDWKL